VIAQRLVRLVCPACVTQEPLAAPLAARIGLPAGLPVAKANGCDRCRNSGYSKRKGLFELISVDGPVRSLINDAASEGRIEAAGLQQSLKESARNAVREQRTTPTEVLSLFQGEPVRMPPAAAPGVPA
jgi:type II secretory ATPase GspE/PulE/Tfp pilus assembly ATPase PilB-like protein